MKYVMILFCLLFTMNAKANLIPELQCKVIDFTPGSSNTWSSHCTGEVLYGENGQISFRIVNDDVAESYILLSDSISLSSHNNFGNLHVKLPINDSINVIVLDQFGNSHTLTASYSARSICPDCQVP